MKICGKLSHGFPLISCIQQLLHTGIRAFGGEDKLQLCAFSRAGVGQDGIIRMVEENRYCIDISQQVMATEAILNRVNREILAAHLKHCVQEAASATERGEKIDEFVKALERILT